MKTTSQLDFQLKTVSWALMFPPLLPKALLKMIRKFLKYKFTAIRRTGKWVTRDEDFNTFLEDRKRTDTWQQTKQAKRSHSIATAGGSSGSKEPIGPTSPWSAWVRWKENKRISWKSLDGEVKSHLPLCKNYLAAKTFTPRQHNKEYFSKEME